MTIGFNKRVISYPVIQTELEEEEFKTHLPYKIEEEYIPIEPEEFYIDFGRITHQETNNIVESLAPYQYHIWKLAQQYHVLVVVKPQKSGISTSVLLQDFQEVILPNRGRGKDILVAGQTQEAAYEHISTLKRLIATSDKYRKYLITESKELFFKEEKTKMGIIYIKNPDNAFRPSRIIAVPFQESSFWSWKNVFRVHMSDPAVTKLKQDERAYATGISRVANTNGYVIIESPPRGMHNGFYNIYKQYENNKSDKGTTYTVLVEDAVKAGVVTQAFLDEQKRILKHLYPSVYGSSFIEASGNWFNHDSIAKAKLQAMQYEFEIEIQEREKPISHIVTVTKFNPNTEKYILIDQGYSSSYFAILVLEVLRRLGHPNQIRVLHTEEIESPKFEYARDRVLWLRAHFNTIVNIGFDATNRSEYGMSIADRLGFESDWEVVKQEMAEYKRDGIDLANAMRIVPFFFNTDSKIRMRDHTSNMLDDSRDLIAIDPRFESLTNSLDGAIFDERGMLDKTISPHNDLLEDFMMGMQFFKMKRRGE